MIITYGGKTPLLYAKYEGLFFGDLLRIPILLMPGFW